MASGIDHVLVFSSQVVVSLLNYCLFTCHLSLEPANCSLPRSSSVDYVELEADQSTDPRGAASTSPRRPWNAKPVRNKDTYSVQVRVPPKNNCLSLGPRSHALGRSVESRNPISRSGWRLFLANSSRRLFHQPRLFRAAAIATTQTVLEAQSAFPRI